MAMVSTEISVGVGVYPSVVSGAVQRIRHRYAKDLQKKGPMLYLIITLQLKQRCFGTPSSVRPDKGVLDGQKGCCFSCDVMVK